MQDLSTAKYSYVTRALTAEHLTVAPPKHAPAAGDLVVARVGQVGVHRFLEDPHGRAVRLHPGDLVVGAYGNRYATDFFEGYVPTGTRTHLLTAGGLIGTVASAHSRRGAPTELEVIGVLSDTLGHAVTLEDVARPWPAEPLTRPTTVVVVGSSMNAGKTTTAAGIVRGWRRSGLAAGAGKATGSGSGKDRWVYLDAGACAVADFLDFGMASTFGYPADRVLATMYGVRDALAADGATHVVIEIADGLLQTETRCLLGVLPEFADAVVLAVCDGLAAIAGLELLTGFGVRVSAVSGLVTASPLAAAEAATATGLPVLSPSDFADGAAIDLLPLPQMS